MPITREFTFDTHNSVGLLPVGMPGADAGEGRSVAHDMLEHFSFAQPAMEGELLALGAYNLLRYETGVIALNISRDKALSISIREVFDYALANVDAALPPLRRVRNADPGLVSLFTRAVDLAYAGIDDVNEGDLDEDDLADRVERLAALSAAKPAFVSWLMTGHNRAEVRYAKCDLYNVGSTLFETISKEVDDLLASGMLVHGQRVRVSANPRDGYSVNIRVCDPGSSRWFSSNRYH